MEGRNRVKWRAALLAGIIAGLILVVLPHGIPWVASGMIEPSVMGREIGVSPAEEPSVSLAAYGLNLVFGVVYALILAPLVHPIRNPPLLLLAGAAVGVGLYFLNYLLFTLVFPDAPNQQVWSALVIHMAFGMMAAGIYRGLAKRPAIESAS